MSLLSCYTGMLNHFSMSLFIYWHACLFIIPILLRLLIVMIISISMLVTQFCLTLCNPMDYSPPGSSVHGIFQARILKWVAIPFSRGFSQTRAWTQVSCIADMKHLCQAVNCFQFSSITQSCPTLCDPMNRSTPGLPVHHELPEFTETHVHRVSDAIQPSHSLSSPSPLATNPSQHQSLFQWVNSSHEVAKVLEFQL